MVYGLLSSCRPRRWLAEFGFLPRGWSDEDLPFWMAYFLDLRCFWVVAWLWLWTKVVLPSSWGFVSVCVLRERKVVDGKGREAVWPVSINDSFVSLLFCEMVSLVCLLCFLFLFFGNDDEKIETLHRTYGCSYWFYQPTAIDCVVMCTWYWLSMEHKAAHKLP